MSIAPGTWAGGTWLGFFAYGFGAGPTIAGEIVILFPGFVGGGATGVTMARPPVNGTFALGIDCLGAGGGGDGSVALGALGCGARLIFGAGAGLGGDEPEPEDFDPVLFELTGAAKAGDAIIVRMSP